MTVRSKGPERRAQIVEAVLELLAETPLASLTTRQIAERLSISQPALFRHFRSREDLLLAVVSRARSDLGAVAADILAGPDGSLEQLQALALAVVSHVRQHPGLGRLLFSLPEPGPLRTALIRLVSIQTALIAELVRQAQGEGALRPELDPDETASLFVGMIQGIVLRGLLTTRGKAEPAADVEAMLRLWLDGARGRADDGTEESGARAPTAKAPTCVLRTVDVRPILKAGEDPLEEVLAALADVHPGGVLTIVAPFRPAPLLVVLCKRGHATFPRQIGEALWEIGVVVGGVPAIEELTDLEPPEPLERVLIACERLTVGDVYLARLPRVPRLLLPHLRERGLVWEIGETMDRRALLRVWRKP